MAKKKQTIHIKDSEFRSAVAAARTAFHMQGRVPTIEEINAVCDVPMHRLGRILSDEAFAQYMEASGINWKKHKGLTAQQNYLLQILTNPIERRSFEQCLRDCAVTYIQYKSWMKDPLFSGIISQFSEAALGEHMAVAHNSLMKKVETGDVRALEFYYKITGRYDPADKSERDVQSVLAGVIDIIQRNVSDPDTLRAIAGEIKQLMGGPVTQPAISAAPYRDEKAVDAVEVEFEEENARLEGEMNPYQEAIPNIIPPVAKVVVQPRKK